MCAVVCAYIFFFSPAANKNLKYIAVAKKSAGSTEPRGDDCFKQRENKYHSANTRSRSTIVVPQEKSAPQNVVPRKHVVLQNGGVLQPTCFIYHTLCVFVCPLFVDLKGFLISLRRSKDAHFRRPHQYGAADGGTSRPQERPMKKKQC